MSRSAAREARAGAAALILGGPSSAAAQGLARTAVEALLPPHAGPAQLRDGVGAGASSGAERRLRPRPLAVQPRGQPQGAGSGSALRIRAGHDPQATGDRGPGDRTRTLLEVRFGP